MFEGETGGGSAAGDPQLAVDRLEMTVNRVSADEELVGDLEVGEIEPEPEDQRGPLRFVIEPTRTWLSAPWMDLSWMELGPASCSPPGGGPCYS